MLCLLEILTAAILDPPFWEGNREDMTCLSADSESASLKTLVHQISCFLPEVHTSGTYRLLKLTEWQLRGMVDISLIRDINSQTFEIVW